MVNRWVLHVDMDAFFASVEQLTRPTLAQRPVLVGGVSGRGVVAGASYQARAFGARSAMPMHQARRLVGLGAVVLPPRGRLYGKVSESIFTAMRESIPVIEQLSFDEAFGEPAELSGASKETALAFAERLRTQIKLSSGITASIGLGSGKQIAKICSTLAKPDGVLAVSPGEEQEFLRPLPVRKIWGIGPVAGDKLARLGIETIGNLAELTTKEIISILGSTLGPGIHQLAQGIDTRPVQSRAEAKSISSETTFAQDINSLAVTRQAVIHEAAQAHRRLVKDGRSARTVTVKYRKADFSIVTRSVTLTAATSDLAALTEAAQRVLLDPLEIGPIRLVGVGYSGLTTIEQFALFSDGESGVLDTIGEEVGKQLAEVTQPPLRAGHQLGWYTGIDLLHKEFGFGWVQGSGHGVVSVRFETRSSGPGKMRTFKISDTELFVADPLDSLR